MALESGSNVDITYIKEVTHGVTPGSPQMKVLRATSRNVNPTKNLLRSAELRPDRLEARPRHGFRQFSGQVGFELANRAFDDVLESVLGGTWAAGPQLTGVNIAVASPSTFTRAAGSFLTDGWMPGAIFDSAGFTAGADNGQFTVASVTALNLVVTAATLVTEASAAARTLTYTGKKLTSGSDLDTYTLERRFKGVTQFQVGTGVAFNNMALNFSPEAIITATVDTIGMNFAAMSGSSLNATPTAAASDAPFNGFDGVLYEGGVVMALVTALTLQINENRTLQPVLFSNGSPDVFNGTAQISGQLTALFQDSTQYNKFVNETPSTIDVKMNNPNGVDWMRIRVPIIYTGGSMDPPQQGPLPLVMPFQAYPDDTTMLTNLVIQRSNVT